MRLLHASGTHVGVRTCKASRRADLERVFAQITAIARDERVDVILHTGVLFDVAHPPLDEILLAWNALEEWAAVAPVVILCGSHDEPRM